MLHGFSLCKSCISILHFKLEKNLITLHKVTFLLNGSVLCCLAYRIMLMILVLQMHRTQRMLFTWCYDLILGPRIEISLVVALLHPWLLPTSIYECHAQQERRVMNDSIQNRIELGKATFWTNSQKHLTWLATDHSSWAMQRVISLKVTFCKSTTRSRILLLEFVI